MTVMNTGYATIEEAWGDMSGRRKKKKTSQDPICDLYETKGSSSAYTETDLVNYAYDKNRTQRTYNDRQETKKVVVHHDAEVYEAKQLPNSLFEKQFDIRHPGNFEMDDPKDYMIRSCPSSSSRSHAREDDGDYAYDDEDAKRRAALEVSARERDPVVEETRARAPRGEREPARRETYYSNDTDDEYEPPRRRRAERVFQEDDSSDVEHEYKAYARKYSEKSRSKFVYLDMILYVLSGIILIFLLEQFVRIGINMQMV